MPVLAWDAGSPLSSQDMDPQAFKAGLGPKGSSSGLPVVKLGGVGGMRQENGTAVIS